MTSLQDIIEESLLDMDEKNADKSVVKNVTLNIIHDLFSRSQNSLKFKDSYGRKLNVGDIVMGNYVGLSLIGTIVAFDSTGYRCAVNFTGCSVEDLKNKDGEFSYLNECCRLIKIPSLKILRELIK